MFVVSCSDEADGFRGLRVQYLDIGVDHTRPASTFFQLRFLSDASASGSFAAIKKAWFSADTRLGELKEMVFTEAQSAQRLCGFIADGASVNGVVLFFTKLVKQSTRGNGAARPKRIQHVVWF